MNIKESDLIEVDFIRSDHLDPDNGIGWWIRNATVIVEEVISIGDVSTVKFQFNEERKCIPIEECRKINSLLLFKKIEYSINSNFFRNKNL